MLPNFCDSWMYLLLSILSTNIICKFENEHYVFTTWTFVTRCLCICTFVKCQVWKPNVFFDAYSIGVLFCLQHFHLCYVASYLPMPIFHFKTGTLSFFVQMNLSLHLGSCVSFQLLWTQRRDCEKLLLFWLWIVDSLNIFIKLNCLFPTIFDLFMTCLHETDKMSRHSVELLLTDGGIWTFYE